MLSTALIIFREIIEISMIIGVVLAATRGVPRRGVWVVGGFVGGCVGAGLVALFARTISESLSGMGQEFFNAMVLFTASAFIGWTVLWLRKNARTMAADLRKIGTDVVSGKLPLYSLAVIIGLALLREGSEIVLFIYSMVLSGQTTAAVVEGTIAGVAAGGIVGVMLYYGLLKIPARHVLRVTSWLLYVLVAGLASQGVGYLSAAGYFDGVSQQIWDTSWLLSEESVLGRSLHALVGYTARPSLIQVLVYVGVLLILITAAAAIDRAGRAGRVVGAFLILAGAASLVPCHAWALDEIYSPNAEPKELSIEYNASRTFDRAAAKNDEEGHQVQLEYGIMDRLMVATTVAFAKAPLDHPRVADAEIEGRYQFFEQGENWLDSGVLVAYDFALQPRTADQLEVKLLLQKDFLDAFTAMVNAGLTESVGRFSPGDGPDYVFLGNVRYRYNQWIQPGFEVQSDLGTGDILRQTDLQRHYVGPAVYGTLFGALKYQVAYLFGLTDTSSASAGRILLEYETHF
ncbi:MAG: FTR1 family protein [Pseudomonadota bacterium]|nr:FTR1 family protein [Pseudomonadota bacterium]